MAEPAPVVCRPWLEGVATALAAALERQPVAVLSLGHGELLAVISQARQANVGDRVGSPTLERVEVVECRQERVQISSAVVAATLFAQVDPAQVFGSDNSRLAVMTSLLVEACGCPNEAALGSGLGHVDGLVGCDPTLRQLGTAFTRVAAHSN